MFQKIISLKGYELQRISHKPVDFVSFENLTHAYEQHLIETGSSLPENKLRAKLLSRLSGTLPSEAYSIIQALHQTQTQHVFGDVCEFGVAQGETSALMANEIKHQNTKTLHLFDSFEGLPMPSEEDKLKNDILSLGSMEAYAGKMSYPTNMVRARLKAISFPEKQFVIHKGFIKEVLETSKKLPSDVSFAYVDFDFYEPIRDTLLFLDKVTKTGSIIIVDDYDYFSTGAKEAVDEFIKEKNSVQSLYKCYIPHTRYGYFAVLTKI